LSFFSSPSLLLRTYQARRRRKECGPQRVSFLSPLPLFPFFFSSLRPPTSRGKRRPPAPFFSSLSAVRHHRRQAQAGIKPSFSFLFFSFFFARWDLKKNRGPSSPSFHSSFFPVCLAVVGYSHLPLRSSSSSPPFFPKRFLFIVEQSRKHLSFLPFFSTFFSPPPPHCHGVKEERERRYFPFFLVFFFLSPTSGQEGICRPPSPFSSFSPPQEGKYAPSVSFLAFLFSFPRRELPHELGEGEKG